MNALLALVLVLGSVLPTPEPAREEITLLFTGDVLVHTPVTTSAERHAAGSDQRFDFSPMFEAVRPAIAAADLALCHLETVLAVPGVERSGYPRIAAPGEVAAALAGAGFDGCSTASNHSLDFGEPGVLSTLASLVDAGLGASGTAWSPESADGSLYRVGPATVAHLSYSYGFNGFRLPADAPWLANLIDPDRIEAEAARWKEQGADLVVVSLHWGAEYRRSPTAAQVELSERLRASPDIDLLVGHHAHVVQPIASGDGVPLAFGLGNFLSNQTPGCCTADSGDGVALLVRAVEADGGWQIAELAALPTWVDRRAGHLVLPARDVDRPEAPGSASRTEEALESLGVEVDQLGVSEAVGWLSRHRIADLLVRLFGGGGGAPGTIKAA